MSHRRSKYSGESPDTPRLTLPVSEDRDHIAGSSDAKVTIVEYGDYQCPYCGEAYPILKRIQKDYGSKLRFVFRNFPLTDMHPHAEFGAETAEAAGALGKFWEMHDFLYEHQSSLGNQDFFFDYAKKLGLDREKIKESVSKRAFAERIREDFMSGVRSGVNGTPSFYINDLRHDAGYEYDSLAEAIDSILKRK